ncbi:PREDICTED: uncharacterized protein LOC104802928 [Tarenaya hassleriana]|uniref:uncharacterized protein LOC104802928 n=1 Tax=Tarenaya hassleriana TaxID=28532 RepID=UPI00053C3EBD|nr:PREDICTED: uncharacterized protein LOC104802928 [Tarenaya hassleriana]
MREREREMEERELVHLPIHPHPLRPCDMSIFYCEMCRTKQNNSDGYSCETCISAVFHRECAASPLELHHHPYHPPHSLTLCPLNRDLGEASEICSFCAEKLGGGWVYHCPACSKFVVHLLCARKPPAFEVAHPKSHGHKLFLLPKPRLFTCDACGLTIDSPSLPWACLQCGAMLHGSCVDLPRVIRISRHHHRLRYASSPPPPPPHEAWSCGVCRKVVDNQYGAYLCSNSCRYVVHSKCATREDVWDGQDHEGTPEEPEDVEEPFEVINDKVIRHFIHGHHLELNEVDGARLDGSEHCQICALPIRVHSGSIYRCTQFDCGFVLHETCGNLPRMTWYMLHPHRLKLQTCGVERRGCRICPRYFSGLMYDCSREDCHFGIDVHCAAVSEPLLHITHPHPLFSLSSSLYGKTCSGCKRIQYFSTVMECIRCDFYLCFTCITLPPKVSYKHDRHPLVLVGGAGGEEATVGGENWWCEICEGKMNPEEELYYTCDICCVTVHVSCLLGEDPHLKPGHYSDPFAREFNDDDYDDDDDGYYYNKRRVTEFEILANISCSRPLCHRCQRRCPFPIVFKENDRHFCTYYCLYF